MRFESLTAEILNDHIGEPRRTGKLVRQLSENARATKIVNYLRMVTKRDQRIDTLTVSRYGQNGPGTRHLPPKTFHEMVCRAWRYGQQRWTVR